MNHLRLILITGLSLIALSACQESPNETAEDVSEARQDAQEDVSKARSEEAEEVGDAREAAQSDLNEEAAKARRDAVLAEAGYYGDIPFAAEKVDGLRYYYENPAYSYSDAIILHCMMRHCRPKRVIEIGSGFSSCVMLDTDEVFLGGSISFTFIEPYPALLVSLIKESDKNKVTIIPHRLQELGLSVFDSLYRGVSAVLKLA